MPLLPVAKSGSKFLSTLPARGATFWISVRSLKAWPFLSTLPARGATDGLLAEGDRGHISIHAPREGSDPVQPLGTEVQHDFYPRSPRGERPSFRYSPCCIHHFYPRSPRGERPVIK